MSEVFNIQVSKAKLEHFMNLDKNLDNKYGFYYFDYGYNNKNNIGFKFTEFSSPYSGIDLNSFVSGCCKESKAYKKASSKMIIKHLLQNKIELMGSIINIEYIA